MLRAKDYNQLPALSEAEVLSQKSGVFQAPKDKKSPFMRKLSEFHQNSAKEFEDIFKKTEPQEKVSSYTGPSCGGPN